MLQPQLNAEIKTLLDKGTVIPAHPLALTASRTLDENRQRRLTRYYIACGAGGIAVGVHTTQFEIRSAGANLFETVLKVAAEEIDNAQLPGAFIKIAGIVGPTSNAISEARLALKYGYHLGLVSLGGLNDYSDDDLITHVRQIAEIIPVFGFYLQPAVGGRVLGFNFWKQFVEIPNVHAIKVAAFNRYQTLDVVRAVCESENRDQIALYTGNDDNIVADLLTPYRFNVNGKQVEKRFVGGLLGHWAVWTKKAVELFRQIKNCVNNNPIEIEKLLTLGIAVTDMNAVIFDSKNSFHGCIAGIHEVLRRQGLLEGIWCLNPAERLSDGQMQEIDRVCAQYAELIDDEFVNGFIAEDNSIVSHVS